MLKKRVHVHNIDTIGDNRIDYSGTVPFLLIVIASYVSWLVNASSARLTAWNLPVALVLGGAYCVVGTAGFARLRSMHQPRSRAIASYFVAQLILGFGAAGLLEGINSITILLIPLAWQSVLVRSRVALILVNGMLCVGVILLYGVLRPDWMDAMRMSATLLAGVIAAMLFGQLAVREQDMRQEVSRLAADLQAKNHELRAYAATAEAVAVTNERNRLAREIHDTLGHYLTAAAMQVQSARAMLATSGLAGEIPDVFDALRKAEGLSQEALTDVRRSVHALHETSLAQRSLPEALQELVDSTQPATGVQVELVIAGRQRPLTPQTDLTLYRVAQEGLTNVHKHAHASVVQIGLVYTATGIRLTVRDDGIGLPNEALREMNEAAGTGFGLIGLQERITLLGGSMHTGENRDGGFCLEVTVAG